ncbi:MAG: RNA ligase family protein [Candidatus Parvarchaeum sp.]
MEKYPKVLPLAVIKQLDLLTKGTFYLQEKIDGSQFRFGIDSSGNMVFGSKSVEYGDIRPVEKMFSVAVESATAALIRYKEMLNNKDLACDTVFYAEYLKAPKHNTLKYDRVPLGNLMVFDCQYHGRWMSPDGLRALAGSMGLEAIPTYLSTDSFPIIADVKQLLEKQAPVLGGSFIEGVVIKNYDMIVPIQQQVRPLMYKYVRDDFRELNQKNWKEQPGKKPIIDEIDSLFNKQAIFLKAVQHLQEDGKYTGQLKDIATLIPLIHDDLNKEYKPEITKMLWEYYEREIKNSIIRGLPQFYKDYLYKKAEEALNEKTE